MKTLSSSTSSSSSSSLLSGKYCLSSNRRHCCQESTVCLLFLMAAVKASSGSNHLRQRMHLWFSLFSDALYPFSFASSVSDDPNKYFPISFEGLVKFLKILFLCVNFTKTTILKTLYKFIVLCTKFHRCFVY